MHATIEECRIEQHDWHNIVQVLVLKYLDAVCRGNPREQHHELTHQHPQCFAQGSVDNRRVCRHIVSFTILTT